MGYNTHSEGLKKAVEFYEDVLVLENYQFKDFIQHRILPE